jgi:2-oxoglutarate ferredoxin oxidoreductase subunit delta
MGTIHKKRVNKVNLIVSIIVFGTGLILLIKFHMGFGAFQTEWLGITKSTWLLVHRVAAIGFLAGFVLHLATHLKYIKKIAERWRHTLPKKIKTKSKVQILLLILTIIVLAAGFLPWIVMPGASLENDLYHGWIDIHIRVGIVFLTGLLVHILKRRKRVFAANTAEIHSIENIPNGREARIEKARSGRHRVHSSKYIYADTSKCEACWKCIEVCKYGVLGKVDLWFHKHVKFKNADECRGCKKCIAACPNGVFLALTGLTPKNETESASETAG